MKQFFSGGSALRAVIGMLPIALLAVSEISTGADAGVPQDIPWSLRLSPSQYRQSIADIFGNSITITGRFEPETREEGLLAIGARKSNITDTGLQRYDELARGIASQVVDEQHRALLIPCEPKDAKGPDDACAGKFFARAGRLLYRRPLTKEEVVQKVKAAHASAVTLKNFYAGLSASLAQMLISADFLFRINTLEPDPNHPGLERLDAFSRASELSFFLWNTSPDDELLKSAESGAIQTSAGLHKQVDRLLSSRRLESGVRAFFADMLGFADFETVSKDPAFFPRYTLTVKEQSQEQTLRTLIELLLVKQGDYRDVFTTPDTFLTRSLAALYGVPLIETTDNGQPQRWFPYRYAPGDPRAGILSQASFVALYSPAGRTSPTGRGKALRENLLCQAVPPPPGNVDFKFVQDTNNPIYKTTRARLTAHRSEPLCAGCHRITDPLGLALENFDAAGGYRTAENGETIDASGEINNVKFVGPEGLGKAIHDDPAATACVAKKAFAFSTGRLPPANDAEWKAISQKFSDSQYNFVALLGQIALSNLAYSGPQSKLAASATK